MKVRSLLLILVLTVMLSGCGNEAPNDLAVITLPNDFQITSQVANSPSEQHQGLSGTESLVDNEGMLFIYDSALIPSYWMKGMLFSLDFIWLNEGYIVDLTENVAPENPPTTYYSPSSPVDQVLEVNAGFIEKHSLSVGDYLDIDLPGE